MIDEKTGILLLSHGSRLDDGEEVIKAYTDMYREEFPNVAVEYGFMEIRKPGIPETINKLTKENDLERIIVFLYLSLMDYIQKGIFQDCLELKVILRKKMHTVIIITITATTMDMVTDIIITIMMKRKVLSLMVK